MALSFLKASANLVDLNNIIIPSDNFTIMVWVNLDDWSAFYSFIEQYFLGQAGRVIFGSWGATGEILFQIGGTATKGNTPIPTGSYHHVAVTKAGANVLLYLDGVSDGGGANANTPLQTHNSMLVGPSTQYLNGDLDNPRIYNVVKTQPQIAAIVAALGNDGDTTGLLGEYRLNELPIGQPAVLSHSILDNSGNDFHGSPTNSPIYSASILNFTSYIPSNQFNGAFNNGFNRIAI